MDNGRFIELAKEAVARYFNNGLITGEDILTKDVYVVWLAKTLQNNKALLSTNIPDGRYYEVTYNGDKSEMYLDSYVKEHNEAIHLTDDLFFM